MEVEEENEFSSTKAQSETPAAMANHSEDLAPSEEQVHQPLPNASTHIRLLRFSSDSNGNDDVISVCMSAWLFAYAPPYKAMSYTWGPVDEEEHINVNGRTIPVRRNCQYVLWQARLHCPDDYIWIDSICINQVDLGEKSVQVAMMFEIYSAASLVLACIGPHDDDSIELFENTASRMAKGEDGHNSYYQFMIADRPYFQRLWIVQELFAAKHKMELLCGSDRLSWASILWLSGRSKTGTLEATGLWFNPNGWATEACSSATAWRLDEVLEETRSLECSDPRDRLFGLLSLIEWPPGVDAIAPDYTRSPFEIARQLASHLDDAALEDMLRAFKVPHDSTDMMDLVKKRERLSVELSPHACVSKSYRESTYICGYGGAFTLMGRLEHHHLPGYLTSPLLGFLMIDASDVKDILAAFPELEKSQQPLMYKQSRLGLLCANARAGDTIVAISGQKRLFPGYGTGARGWLVLRNSHDDHYDVVGQAIVPTPAGLSAMVDYRPYDKADQLYAKLEVSLTAEDKLVLVGQDLKDRESDPYRERHRFDVEACFRRLATCPVADPQCAVKITWQGSAKDMRENHSEWYQNFDVQRRRNPRGY